MHHAPWLPGRPLAILRRNGKERGTFFVLVLLSRSSCLPASRRRSHAITHASRLTSAISSRPTALPHSLPCSLTSHCHTHSLSYMYLELLRVASSPLLTGGISPSTLCSAIALLPPSTIAASQANAGDDTGDGLSPHMLAYGRAGRPIPPSVPRWTPCELPPSFAVSAQR